MFLFLDLQYKVKERKVPKLHFRTFKNDTMFCIMGLKKKWTPNIHLNKTKDWALVQNAALVMKIKVLKLGLVR